MLARDRGCHSDDGVVPVNSRGRDDSRRALIEAGALMSYAPSYLAMHRAAADFADRIIKGSSPDECPSSNRPRLKLVLYLKAARGGEIMGADFDPSLPLTPLLSAREDQSSG